VLSILNLILFLFYGIIIKDYSSLAGMVERGYRMKWLYKIALTFLFATVVTSAAMAAYYINMVKPEKRITPQSNTIRYLPRTALIKL
jgi:hypothetical protein